MSAGKEAVVGSDWMDEAAVAVLARSAGFAFTPEELPAIVVQLRRACDIAAPLLAAELREDEELGPVWRP